jgi:diazepam-binding inhibitor (GABA receptor modulator, acyl-CoA-binding protein)
MRSVVSDIGRLLGWLPCALPDLLGKIAAVNIILTYRRRTMASLKAKFEKAVTESKSLPEKPDNSTMLKIYALYKQASAGDVEGKRPGMTDFVGRAKYDAWAGVKGKSANEAMQEYVDLIESLK